MEKDLGQLNERFLNILKELERRVMRRRIDIIFDECNKICDRIDHIIFKLNNPESIEKEFTRLFYESRNEILYEEIHLSVGKSG